MQTKTPDVTHSFYDGKYTLTYNNGRVVEVLRGGEPWDRDLVGDGLVLAMFQDYDDLKTNTTDQLTALKQAAEIYGADIEVHHQLLVAAFATMRKVEEDLAMRAGFQNVISKRPEPSDDVSLDISHGLLLRMDRLCTEIASVMKIEDNTPTALHGAPDDGFYRGWVGRTVQVLRGLRGVLEVNYARDCLEAVDDVLMELVDRNTWKADIEYKAMYDGAMSAVRDAGYEGMNAEMVIRAMDEELKLLKRENTETAKQAIKADPSIVGIKPFTGTLPNGNK